MSENGVANPESENVAEGPNTEVELLQELDPKPQADAERVEAPNAARGIDAIMDVSMNVQIVLGRCRLPVSELLELGRGSIVELDRRIGDAVDVLVNDRLVARGDLVKLANDRVGVTLNEIVETHGGDE